LGTNVGDEGLSAMVLWKGDSIDDAELGYLIWPRLENVGVTGEGIEFDELCE